MLINRKNLIFKLSLAFIAVLLLYAAMNHSGYSSPGIEWMPITLYGSETNVELGYIQQKIQNEINDIPVESGVRDIKKFMSKKTILTSNTTSRIKSTGEMEKKTTKPVITNKILDIIDNNSLSEATLARLRTLIGCNNKDFFRQTKQRGEYWVLKNYVRADHGNILCHESITYTTHADFKFLDNVLPLVERWMAPVSLAIHAPGEDLIPTVDSIRYLRDCLGNDLVRHYVTFHVFFPNKHIPSSIPDPEDFLSIPYNCSENPPYVVNASTTYKQQNNLLYPVNVARNVAREAALTHYILVSDIELYPSSKLMPEFLKMIARHEKPLNTSTNLKVFPISIFEIDANVQVPSNKTQLQHMLANKTAIPFHKFMCPKCHNIPEGDRWMSTPEAEHMDVFHVGKRDDKFKHWEPIFIGTHRDPYYDERLSWEGKRDKMTQSYVLCVKDYDFMILNNAFLFHKPGIKKYVPDRKRGSIASQQSTFIDNVIMPELKIIFGSRKNCTL